MKKLFLLEPEGQGEDRKLDKLQIDNALVQELIEVIRTKAAPLTRETAVPHSDVKRQPVFRFERGQILAIYKLLRHHIAVAKKHGDDPTKIQAVLQKFKEGAKVLEKEFDTLNRQLYTVDQTVKIHGEKIGEHEVPVIKFDLRPESEEPDTRIPYVLCGTFLSDVEHNAEFAMALALAGHKVYAFPYPERSNVKSPADWDQKLKQEPTFGLHSEYMKKTIESLGLEQVNIMGYSMGGGVALELASDPEMQGKIHDLMVLEPSGFEKKSLPKGVVDFGLRNGLGNVLLSREKIAKNFVLPWAEKHKPKDGVTLPVMNINLGKHFSPEKLATIQPKGKFQVWLADKSAVSAPAKTAEMFHAAVDEHGGKDVKIYHIEDAGHDAPSVQTLGMVKEMLSSQNSHKPGVDEEYLNAHQLENSAAQLVLQRVLEQSL